MNEKIYKFTENLISSTSDFNDTVKAKSKKYMYPSRKAMKVGSTVGICVGLTLMTAAATGYILGKTIWPTGTLVGGIVTLCSNTFTLYRFNKQ